MTESAAEQPTPLASLHMARGGEAGALDVFAGQPVFVLGRNGVGKSALVHQFRTQLGNRAIYIPGARPAYFDSESLSLTPATRRGLTGNLLSWDTSPDSRWRSISGTQRNEKAIHDLFVAETQYKIDAANDIKREGASSSAIARLQSDSSPLDRVNSLLLQASLPVQVVLNEGELQARRNSQIYSLAKMSDGERSALIIAAEAIAAPAQTIFLIDEPELHLHRSISVPLLKAIVTERPDSAFVISTHELALPAETANAKLLLIRSCEWERGQISRWEIDILSNGDDVPEDVRLDILGSRRKILFVEGTADSLDQPIYALLFPAASVRSKGSAREVIRAVHGIRETEATHRARAFGVIDGDGMSGENAARFREDGIYPLEVYAVESLYYAPEVIQHLAKDQSRTFGVSPESLVKAATQAAIKAVAELSVRNYLAAVRGERRLRELVLSNVPDRHSIADGSTDRVTFDLGNPHPTEMATISEMIRNEDVNGIIARYPVRDTPMLKPIANALRFLNVQDYEKAALRAIGATPELQTALRAKFAELSTLLN